MPGQERVVAVLDYGIGNLRSAEKALVHLGAPAVLTADPGLVREAVGVVLPGVGHFGACMAALRAARLDDVAIAAAESGRPFLGICIGMQMLFEGSDEAPGVAGLRVLPGRVTALPSTVKLPQIGWNTLERVPGSALVERGGAKVVFTLDQGNVRMVPVKLGQPFGDGFELVDGPAPGTKLVSQPPATLEDGQAIKERSQ